MFFFDLKFGITANIYPYPSYGTFVTPNAADKCTCAPNVNRARNYDLRRDL